MIAPAILAPEKTTEGRLQNGHRPEYTLGNFAIDSPEVRPMKVIIVGTGFSGIGAGIRFLQRIPNVQVTIYEKNAGVGGVWWSNRYPGVACDIPSHCYQFTFCPNSQWSSAYARGPEILAYLESVVSKYRLDRHIKLQHEMIGARWDEENSKWRVNIKRLNSDDISAGGEVFEDTADVLFTGIGCLSRWQWPDIEGLHDFKGVLTHTAQWNVRQNNQVSTDDVITESTTATPEVKSADEKADATAKLSEPWHEDIKDWGDKKVAVIGVGSTALQIVPTLQPLVGHLTNFVRSKTWVSPPYASQKLSQLLGRAAETGNYEFSDEERKAFEDPEYYAKFRYQLESEMNSIYEGTLRDTAMQKGAREYFTANMIERLSKKPWIAEHLIPDFGVACRRLTPCPGYLESLCADNADFVHSPIKTVTPTGIETVDGRHHELDVIICATGYDTTFAYPFPIIGRNGVDLRDKWSPYPRTYLSVCVDEFPNWFFASGPNSAVQSGSLLAVSEYQVDYAVSAVLKMQRERLKTMEIQKEAVDDYDEYMKHYFPTTVYMEKCRSWYKMGKEDGHVAGLWPGSCLHALTTLKNPRWEDFTYERVDGQRNRLHWLGNGITYSEQTMSGDRAWYLKDRDVPPVPVTGEHCNALSGDT